MSFDEQLEELKSQGLEVMQSKQTISEKCPLCNGEGGQMTIDENGYDVWKPCKCWFKEMRKRSLRFANIPTKYKDATFDNYQTDIYKNAAAMEKLKKLCKTYAEEFEPGGKGIYLHSEVKGSGKSRMICTIGNALMEKGLNVKFSTMGSILDKIKESWGDSSEYTESKLKDELKSVDVLILDDFGMDKSTDWVNSQVYDIINYRYNEKKTTLYTSNYSLNNMDYDERIINRVIETCYQIGWANESIREQGATENVDEVKKMYANV